MHVWREGGGGKGGSEGVREGGGGEGGRRGEVKGGKEVQTFSPHRLTFPSKSWGQHGRTKYFVL